MPKQKDLNEPIQQSVHVDCPPDEAFRLFTEGFGEWWPLALYSTAAEDLEECAIEPWIGGKVFEITRSGEKREWGSVTGWDPPAHLEFTWYPGTGPDESQRVTVDFRVEADGTRVTLTHYGWQWAAAGVCASGLSRFVAQMMVAA